MIRERVTLAWDITCLLTDLAVSAVAWLAGTASDVLALDPWEWR